MKPKIEQTLVLLKPDACKRGLRGKIITRFEEHGYAIVKMEQFLPDRELIKKLDVHYDEIGKLGARVGADVLMANIEYMASGPVVAMVIEGPNAISGVRKIVGATQPSEAAPGTIRGDFCPAMTYAYSSARENNTALPNLVHASSSVEDANAEIRLWFGSEVPTCYSYSVAGEEYLR